MSRRTFRRLHNKTQIPAVLQHDVSEHTVYAPTQLRQGLGGDAYSIRLLDWNEEYHIQGRKSFKGDPRPWATRSSLYVGPHTTDCQDRRIDLGRSRTCE